jgi:uncharacterized protein DUF6600
MAGRLALAGFALACLASIAGCGGTRPPTSAPLAAGACKASRIAPADLARFRDALAPHGEWLDLEPYGTVWAPLGVRGDWRPYTHGRWTYTDLGWLWLGDEPWAWATYHYGRWKQDADHGWIWVPSSTWASAWVAWRRGKGWVGWAPLPPEAGWSAAGGLTLSGSDLDRAIPERTWSFVPSQEFTSPKVQGRIAPVGRNATLIPLTTGVTRYGLAASRPAERGMTAEGVGPGRPPRPARVVAARTPRLNRAEIVSRDMVQVYRPELIQEVPERDRPVSSARGLGGSPMKALLDRDRREQSKLEAALRSERDRLGRQQADEARRPPSGVSRDALKRRHESEIKEQERFEQELRVQAGRRKEWLAGR